MSVSIKQFFYWGVGGLALIALADPYPDFATILTIILIAGVFFAHSSDYIAMFNAVTPGKK